MLKILAVGFGGFFGATLRYIISTSFPFTKFPFATLGVNLLASILIALAVAYFAKINNIYLQLFVISGFLGALSTYSTFAYESYLLLDSHKSTLLFFANIALNAFGTILVFFLSFRLFSFLLK